VTWKSRPQQGPSAPPAEGREGGGGGPSRGLEINITDTAVLEKKILPRHVTAQKKNVNNQSGRGGPFRVLEINVTDTAVLEEEVLHRHAIPPHTKKTRGQ
jgi:hypothetical protein